VSKSELVEIRGDAPRPPPPIPWLCVKGSTPRAFIVCTSPPVITDGSQAALEQSPRRQSDDRPSTSRNEPGKGKRVPTDTSRLRYEAHWLLNHHAERDVGVRRGSTAAKSGRVPAQSPPHRGIGEQRACPTSRSALIEFAPDAREQTQGSQHDPAGAHRTECTRRRPALDSAGDETRPTRRLCRRRHRTGPCPVA